MPKRISQPSTEAGSQSALRARRASLFWSGEARGEASDISVCSALSALGRAVHWQRGLQLLNQRHRRGMTRPWGGASGWGGYFGWFHLLKKFGSSVRKGFLVFYFGCSPSCLGLSTPDFFFFFFLFPLLVLKGIDFTTGNMFLFFRVLNQIKGMVEGRIWKTQIQHPNWGKNCT